MSPAKTCPLVFLTIFSSASSASMTLTESSFKFNKNINYIFLNSFNSCVFMKTPSILTSLTAVPGIEDKHDSS